MVRGVRVLAHSQPFLLDQSKRRVGLSFAHCFFECFGSYKTSEKYQTAKERKKSVEVIEMHREYARGDSNRQL